MARYLVSYDLTGDVPTHAEVDTHIKAAQWDAVRILQSVWVISTAHDRSAVFDYIVKIFSKNDRLIVAGIDGVTRRNLRNLSEYKRLWD